MSEEEEEEQVDELADEEVRITKGDVGKRKEKLKPIVRGRSKVREKVNGVKSKAVLANDFKPTLSKFWDSFGDEAEV